jgi:hypothetical protein
MRGVAALDLPWSDGSHPWRGDGEGNPSLCLPNRDGGKRRPPIAPGCRGSRGAPDGRGRRGAPRRASALSSPGKQKKGRKEEEVRRRQQEDKEKRSPWTQMPSPGQNPGALNHAIEGWGPGVGLRRDPPQLP